MSSWFRRFVTGENSVGGASAIMIVTLMASNVLGLFRDRFLAQQIPTDRLDTYFAAFRIPDLLFNVLILGAVSASFIPLLTQAFREDEENAWHIARATLNFAVLALTLLAGLFALLMPWLIPLVVPSFGPEKQQLTIEVARILMIQPIFFGASYMFSAMLTARRRFVVYAIAPLVYNISIITATLLFAREYHVKAVIIGVVVGAFLHFAMQAVAARSIGFRWQPVLDLRNPVLRKVALLMLPRSIGLGGMQVVLVIFTALASSLAAGSIAIYNLADNIQTMPLAVFGISFATALFPTLSDAFAAKDEPAFSRYLIRGFRYITFLMIPSSLGLILLRAQIIRLILGSGYFNWDATVAAAATLGWFAVGLTAEAIVHLLSRAFYARHNTAVPMGIALSSYLVMILSGWFMSQSIGVAGLAIGFSLGSIVQACWLYLKLRPQLPTLAAEESTLGLFIGQVLIASVALVVGVQAAKFGTVAFGADMTRAWGVLLQTAMAILFGSAAFAAVSHYLELPELGAAWQTVRRRLSVGRAEGAL